MACRTDAGGRVAASPSGIEWLVCSLASSPSRMVDL